jgi:phosphoribosylanthranilate isomerase
MEERMITQIYGITDPDYAVEVCHLGADRIGLVICEDESITPDGLTMEEARAIKAVVPDEVTVIGLTFSTDLDEIEAMVRELGADVLHLSAIDVLGPGEVRKLLQRVPGLKVMQAIPVRDEGAVELAVEFEELVESILLDTAFEGVKVGATGKTHDWSVSRRIVEECSKPVILAGGLSPQNVAEAIKTVRPWGVDSFTLTSYPDNLKRKDLGLVREFIDAARRA